MGLEKVGMYIKTVTDGNVVHQDSRIQVNDLLMEMDGMNLVGSDPELCSLHALEHQGLHAVYDWPGVVSEVAQPT